MSAGIEQRNQDATIYVGNIDEKCNDEIIWEMFLQVGPVAHIHLPKDKVTGMHQGYGFVEFKYEHDSDYALKIMNMIKVFGKPIRVNKATQNGKTDDIGANVFIGNLDETVDEKLLYDTFSAFGGITSTPRVMRDPETGVSKAFGFVSYDSFEASDLAIQCMNGQWLAGKQIVVQYAYKKESQGERHGSQAERLLAAEMQAQSATLRPNTMFAANATPLTALQPAAAAPLPLNSMPPPPMMPLAPQQQPQQQYQAYAPTPLQPVQGGMPPPPPRALAPYGNAPRPPMQGMPPPPMQGMPPPPMQGMPPPPMQGMPPPPRPGMQGMPPPPPTLLGARPPPPPAPM